MTKTDVFLLLVIAIIALLFLIYLRLDKLLDEVRRSHQTGDTVNTISDFLESDIEPRLRKIEDGVKNLAPKK
jgi:hypothetical protein